MRPAGWQKNLVTQARLEFCRAAVPANRMQFSHASLVENDRIVSFDSDESIVERPMKKRAEAKAVLQFIRSALMVNRNDVRRVHEFKLNAADCAAAAVSDQAP
jgi:hypothetical protein